MSERDTRSGGVSEVRAQNGAIAYDRGMKTAINWDEIAAKLDALSIEQLHELEREDYHAYLDDVTVGMSPVEKLSAYELFGTLLRATYEGKSQRAKSA